MLFRSLVTADGKYVTGTMLSNFAYNASFDYGDQATNGVVGAYVLSNPTSDATLSSVGSQGNLEFPARLAYPVEATTQTSFFGNLGVTNETRTISADAISAKNDINRIKLSFTQSAYPQADPALSTSRPYPAQHEHRAGRKICVGDHGWWRCF